MIKCFDNTSTSFDLTYEGLKQFNIVAIIRDLIGFDLTYEGLKQMCDMMLTITSESVLILPMRD